MRLPEAHENVEPFGQPTSMYYQCLWSMLLALIMSFTRGHSCTCLPLLFFTIPHSCRRGGEKFMAVVEGEEVGDAGIALTYISPRAVC
jgi:hypothetical protein